MSRQGSGLPPEPRTAQRAVSVARDSRITVTRICPGYVNSSSTRLATSRAITCACTSSTASGRTITRSSRPACIAKTFSTPSLAA